MTASDLPPNCPTEALDAAIAAADSGLDEGLAAFEALIAGYAADPRLHFLKGALLASLERSDEAKAAFSRCLDLAPSYELARFQLGLLSLVAGDAASAAAVWEPLRDLDVSHPLALFARGLEALACGETQAGVDEIEHGIGLNRATPALNRDMRGFIERARGGQPLIAPPTPAEPEAISAVHLLLQQYRGRTVH